MRGWAELSGLACKMPFIDEDSPEAFIEAPHKFGRWSARVLYPFSSVLPGRCADTRLMILNNSQPGDRDASQYRTLIHLQRRNQAGKWESVAKDTLEGFLFQLEANPDFPIPQPPDIRAFARLAWTAKLDRPLLQSLNDHTIAMRGWDRNMNAAILVLQAHEDGKAMVHFRRFGHGMSFGTLTNLYVVNMDSRLPPIALESLLDPKVYTAALKTLGRMRNPISIILASFESSAAQRWGTAAVRLLRKLGL